MKRSPLSTLVLLGLLACGCHGGKEYYFHSASDVKRFKQSALEIEYPNVASEATPEVRMTAAPRSLEELRPEDMWDLTLEETIRLTMANSPVLRDLGARMLASPSAVPTPNDPAIIESNPRIGVEAALSAFDAQYASSMFWNKVDRPTNTAATFGGIFNTVQEQDGAAYRSELSKVNATGGRSAVRYNVDYLWSNNPTVAFPSAYTNNLEFVVQQPFLQGSGVEFNRINGPASTPGQTGLSTGVLLARLNTDISLADFEAEVRNLVSNVENSYWDLYFAYRDLEAKIAGRDSALETWRRIEALGNAGARGGEAANEAQARQQYFLFRAQVENALSGVSGQSTQTGNGAGRFVGAGGVYARENNLRYLMGLPPTDGRLIRPIDEPSTAQVSFDWAEAVPESLYRRVELRRQKWVIKNRELQLVASRNFLMPRLDGTALYRFYGLGDDYLHPQASGQFNNAVQNLTGGDFQEWQMGLNLNIPLGYRQAYAAVRNAELQVAREKAILKEQELRVVHDLTAAVRELERAYQLTRTNFNRLLAAYQEVKSVRDEVEVGTLTLDVLLQAQRRLSESISDYYRSLVEHNLAIKGVHFEKGTLLEYNGIALAEAEWSPKAYADARRNSQRLVETRLNYRYAPRYQLSQGVFEQQTSPEDVAPPAATPPVDDVDKAPEIAPPPPEAAPAAFSRGEAPVRTAGLSMPEAAPPAARAPVVRAAPGEETPYESSTRLTPRPTLRQPIGVEERPIKPETTPPEQTAGRLRLKLSLRVAPLGRGRFTA